MKLYGTLKDPDRTNGRKLGQTSYGNFAKALRPKHPINSQKMTENVFKIRFFLENNPHFEINLLNFKSFDNI